MLETIREYALEALDAAGETRELRQRHASWCQALADEAVLERTGATKHPNTSQLGVERHNALAALIWLEQSECVDDAFDLATSLWPLWLEHGDVATGRRHLQHLLSQPAASEDPVRRARAMVVLGQLEQAQGDLGAAEQAIEVALPHLREHHDDAWLGSAYTALGLVEMVRGGMDRATNHLESALASFERAGDLRAGSWALRHLSSVAYRQGDIDRYERLAEQGLAIVGPTGDPLDLARLGASLALATSMRGRLDEAAAQFEMSLARYRAAQDAWGEADILQRLGHIAFLRDDLPGARDLLSRSEYLLRQIGDPEGLARTLASQGWLLRREGDLPGAHSRFLEALVLARHHRVRRATARALIGKATIEHDRADSLAAAHSIREALDEVLALGDPLMLVTVIERIALITVETVPDTVAQLLGATTATRERMRVPVPASERAETEFLARSLRLRLGEDRYAAAISAGERDTPGDVIEIARHALEPMESPTIRVNRPQPGPAASSTHDLSSREVEVLVLLTEGRADREISETLKISRRTVATHINHIYAKIGTSSRAAAAAWAVRNGLA
jgi:ATP/maltotriose-dependent transcriptional regulator MalT